MIWTHLFLDLYHFRLYVLVEIHTSEFSHLHLGLANTTDKLSVGLPCSLFSHPAVGKSNMLIGGPS